MIIKNYGKYSFTEYINTIFMFFIIIKGNWKVPSCTCCNKVYNCAKCQFKMKDVPQIHTLISQEKKNLTNLVRQSMKE